MVVCSYFIYIIVRFFGFLSVDILIIFGFLPRVAGLGSGNDGDTLGLTDGDKLAEGLVLGDIEGLKLGLKLGLKD